MYIYGESSWAKQVVTASTMNCQKLLDCKWVCMSEVDTLSQQWFIYPLLSNLQNDQYQR